MIDYLLILKCGCLVDKYNSLVRVCSMTKFTAVSVVDKLTSIVTSPGGVTTVRGWTMANSAAVSVVDKPTSIVTPPGGVTTARGGQWLIP